MATTLKGTIRGGVTFSVSPATVSIPTGSVTITEDKIYSTYTFTVPAGIKVVALRLTEYYQTYGPMYIGVTPGSSHNLRLYSHYAVGAQMIAYEVICGTHHNATWGHAVLCPRVDGGLRFLNYIISWSPEINTHTPDSTDY